MQFAFSDSPVGFVPGTAQPPGRWRAALGLCALALSAGCANAPVAAGAEQVRLPLLRGWFEGQAVIYVTTDVSQADMAQAKGANFVPRLADALPPAGPPQPGRRSPVDKVYAVTNFEQASVFASAPAPVGPLSRDTAYSPLWQLVKVTWAGGAARQTLRSEEDILSAAAKGQLALEPTRVVLNCPIVQVGPPHTRLPGVDFGRATDGAATN